jgi:GTP-binding protein
LLALIAPRVAEGPARLLVLLTKADKLNRRESDGALRRAQAVLAALAGDGSDIGVALFSSLSRQGLDDVAETLWSWRRA